MRKTLLVLLAVLALYACDDRYNKVQPEDSAKKFADDMGLKVQGKPNCTGVDTDNDNDGYVTCTVMVAPASEGKDPKMMSLQCAGVTGDGCNAQTSKYATGCKETQPKVQVQQGQQEQP